jgi:hypothetical protein
VAPTEFQPARDSAENHCTLCLKALLSQGAAANAQIDYGIPDDRSPSKPQCWACTTEWWRKPLI